MYTTPTLYVRVRASGSAVISVWARIQPPTCQVLRAEPNEHVCKQRQALQSMLPSLP